MLQFAIILNIFGNTRSNKYNIYKRDWDKFDGEIYILDYFLNFSIDWEN